MFKVVRLDHFYQKTCPAEPIFLVDLISHGNPSYKILADNLQLS